MKSLLALVFSALLLAGCGDVPQTEVSRYTDECHARGGFVSTQPESWSTRYECVGESPELPVMFR